MKIRIWPIDLNFLFISYLFLGAFTGYCSSTTPEYYDPDVFNDCFQGAKGWYHLAGTCIFPLTQFERNYSTAILTCGAVNHSLGYREKNWLIAAQLMDIFAGNTDGRDLFKLYWTGLKLKDEEWIGVETEANDTTYLVDFTSIYNPLWADGQPPEDTSSSLSSCIALDLRNSSSFGWRLVPCTVQLPILCQNYGCLPGTFRCLDNSKCIPAGFVNDGFNDCLDGSDESGHVTSTAGMMLRDTQNPTYEWPMEMSSGGVLSPSTIRYGRGECTHRWMIVSPSDRHFVVYIKWLSSSTSTTILIEGKDQNGTVFLNSRNATSSVSLLSSSFLLTARDTDTRRMDFQVYYQEIDSSLCHLSPSNLLFFDSSSMPMPCNYRFSTDRPDSYIAILVKKSQGPTENFAFFEFNNSTKRGFLSPSSTKKLLIFPANSVRIRVNSSWPGSETQLEMQFFELRMAENLDIFMVDRDFEIDWIAKSEEIWMGGDFRSLSVHMIMTSDTMDLNMNLAQKSTWKVEKLQKTCAADNIQLISKNTSTYIQSSQNFNGLGPTSIIIHQSAEPFEFRAVYSMPESHLVSTNQFLDEEVLDENLEEISTTPTAVSTMTDPVEPVKANATICKLPIVENAFISDITSYTYFPDTFLTIQCLDGYQLNYLQNSGSLTLTCSDSGFWMDQFQNGLWNNSLTCYPVQCSGTTPVEDNMKLIPDNYALSYGSVRMYRLWPGLGFGPICVCGDDRDNPTEWQCYNTGNLPKQQQLVDACILPQVADAEFYRLDSQEFDVFPSGSRIRMDCYICPTMQYNFTCNNGLWRNSKGEDQPFGTFQCNCSSGPDFVDPCAPYGTYVELRGTYSCKCNIGFKFQHGTCEDIDECREGNSFCDNFATCFNTIGSYRCLCPPNYHIYNSTNDYAHWSVISNSLIDGFSCVETACNVDMNVEQYGIQVIYPSNWGTYYQSGSVTPYAYATNLCNTQSSCVVPFRYQCLSDLAVPDRFINAACPALDTKVFLFADGNQPYFHIFDIIQVECRDPYQVLIGRPYVFCNATAQWEAMPQCVYSACSNITEFVQQPLRIDHINLAHSNDKYFAMRTSIYFACDNGYTLHGDSYTTCVLFSTGQTRNFIWDNDIPTCISNVQTTTATAPSSSASPFPSTFVTGSPFTFSDAPEGSPTSSQTQTSWFPFNTQFNTEETTTATTTRFQTTSGIIFNDFVIENSVVYEETNWLEKKEIWTMSGDWTWSPANCLIHQWTFPISFLVTSTSIPLNSDEIELIIDISQCRSNLQVSIHSSTDGFIPAISDFRTILNTTSSGSVSVTLKNLKSNLAISIRSNGFVQICGVIVREKKCDDVDFEGVHLKSSSPFQMRRYLPVSCGNRITTVNGYCDSRRGWVIQKTPCLCNPQPPCPPIPTIPPIHYRDELGNCTLNSCENGRCVQKETGGYECSCNDYFIPDVEEDGTPICKPDHCSFTSTIRNNGYNCSSGLDDDKIHCPNSDQLGIFCQYQGNLENSSYTYILRIDDVVATAINVCDNPATWYAVPNSFCPTIPSTTPASNACYSTCPGSGTCSRANPPFQGGAYCICDADAFGRQCTVSKFCYDDDMSYRCQNGGFCSIELKICSCPSDFNGDRCENYIGGDNCPLGVKDCVNGNCRQEIDNMYCNCDDGYLKDASGNCTIPWDMCALNNACQQNGNCQFDVQTGQQTCDCTETSWQGSYCQVQPKPDECSVCENSKQCLSGFTGGVRCECDAGFSGPHCTIPTSDCDFKPCLNDGICNAFNYNDTRTGSTVESYNCTCPSGFSGTNCELTVLRNCQDLITCQNGGTCGFDDRDIPFCRCTHQFYGDFCELACSAQCAHSFGCINNGSVYCDCYDGFTTQYCDVVDDVCKANILLCENNGTCNSTTQSCDCTDAYYGTYCESNGNYCESHSIVCENGGTCMPETNDYTCECPPNYAGQNCENQIHSCSDITCNNGGTCIAFNATCACLPGSTGDRCQDLGQPCKILMPDGSYTDYCLNGGRCLDLPTGAACDCNGTEYSGRRCETKANFNFNLVFNGLTYSPDIVSNGFFNSIISQFTLCSFVQYNHPTTEAVSANGIQDVSFTALPPYLSMRGYGDSSPQMIFDNQGFYICDDSKKCTRPANYRSIPITANTWHHFCVVSPENLVSPSYTVYLDGVNVLTQFAEKFNPGDYGYIQLAPLLNGNTRFVGMISMTQLYLIRLSEKQIADLAFNCYETISNTTSELSQKTFIKWNGNFTRVSSSNPGVFLDPAGICKSVKCMFGRQVNTNNYNSTGSCDKDRIAPTVLRCPSRIRKTTTEDFTQVTWSDGDISFFDNIGVVRIWTNYHNGQQFGIGITSVRYIAYDAADNTAECSFDVIVAQQACPTRITVVDGTATTVPRNLLGEFMSQAVTVTCDDRKFPSETRPRFYGCDIMGHYKYGGYVNNSGDYFLPACGDTVPALQSVNGTVVGRGSCQQVYLKLWQVLWTSAGCETASPPCTPPVILPPCENNTGSGELGIFETPEDIRDTVALQYTFYTSMSTGNLNSAVLGGLQSNFSLVRQDSTVTCAPDHPIKDSSSNVTICVSCPGGTFANQTSESCQDCPVDTYRNPADSDQSICVPCPAGTVTGTVTGAIDKSQCYKNCEIGEFEENGGCKSCPEGTFGDQKGLRKCICCGFDTSTFGDRKTSRADCTKTCPSGQQMERNEQNTVPICVDCMAGYYKEGANGPCVQCPRGLTTSQSASKSIDNCSVLHCIDANTRRNTNVTVGPNTPYSELCVACEQGKFQNISNADTCMPCSELQDTVTDIPITCQSTCSTEIETDGCHCGLQNGTVKTMNCLAVVQPSHRNASAIKIVLPVVFGVLILILLVVLFCFRKQIIAWFRKEELSSNQHVAPSHWNRPSPQDSSPEPSSSTTSPKVLPIRPTIPRPNLRIVTSPEELDRLPPLPSSSTPSFHVDSAFESTSGFVTSSGGKMMSSRHLGTANSIGFLHRDEVIFEANGSPKLVRSPVVNLTQMKENSDDDSSLDSFF